MIIKHGTFKCLNNMTIVGIPEKSGLIINDGTVKNIRFIKKFTL